MEMLPFVTFVLWSTGLSTAALAVAAVIDWRAERRHLQSLQLATATQPQPKKVVAPAAAVVEPALLKAA